MNNYNNFLAEYEHFSDFAHRCFKEYTKDWKGYPGIESTDFLNKGINICYSVYDDIDSLHIPVNFVENNDVVGVVTLWRENAERIKQETRAKQIKEQEVRERAEFARLQAKFSGNTGNERDKKI